MVPFVNELVVKLEFLIPSLPRAEKAVAEYMLNNISQISDMTLAMLADETATSEATILRFCKRMGFSTYIQLRQAFALASLENIKDTPEAISYTDSIMTICEKVIQSICHSLENMRVFISDDYERALNAILNADSVNFFATGDAVSTCMFASAKFNRIGVRSVVCSDVVYQYETALRLTERDVAFGISNSGHSLNVVRSMKLAKEQGATTIAITQTNRSPLMKYTDIGLFVTPLELTIGRDSVTKRVTELAIIESLYLGIINKGTKNYKQMLQNTMLSSELNK